MTNEQLQELRAKILSDIVPLAVSSSQGFDKFNVIVRLIQSGNATPDLFNQAYETAKELPEYERMDALMTLLEEVEVSIGDIEVPLPAQPEAEATQPHVTEEASY